MLSGSPIAGAPLSSLGDGGAVLLPFVKLAPGRNPRLVLDPQGGCLRQELHLFHFVDGQGLRRRSDSELFAQPNFTAETDDAELRIEDAFRTTDRRVSVVYSERDAGAGTLALKRIDSTQYPPEKDPPPAPRFVFNNPAFIPFYRGGLWWQPDDVAVVEDTAIAVVVQSGTAHAVELECSNLFPFGFQPPIWNVQVQEFNLGGALIPNGLQCGFPIELTHGAGSFAPCSFRARARDDSDPLNPCYSPWRYYLAGYWRPLHPAFPDLTCASSYELFGLDAQVCHLPDFTEVAGGRSVAMVYEEYFRAGERVSPTCIFVEGYSPSATPFLVVHDWLFTLRGEMAVAFQDETGRRISLNLESIISASCGEGTAPFTGDPDQNPLDFE